MREAIDAGQILHERGARPSLLPSCTMVNPGRVPGADVSGPAWTAGGLAVLMAAIAAYCAGRLATSWLRGRQTERDADALHVLMGVAMAGMLQPRLAPLPATAWSAVFAAAAAWFAWQAARASGPRRAHRAAHAAECAVMVYMLLPAGAWPRGGGGMAMPGMRQAAAAGNPALTLVLALFMLGYGLWVTDRLASAPRAAAGNAAARSLPAAVITPAAGGAAGFTVTARPGPALAPRLAACYTIAMAIGMAYMLVTML